MVLHDTPLSDTCAAPQECQCAQATKKNDPGNYAGREPCKGIWMDATSPYREETQAERVYTSPSWNYIGEKLNNPPYHMWSCTPSQDSKIETD